MAERKGGERGVVVPGCTVGMAWMDGPNAPIIARQGVIDRWVRAGQAAVLVCPILVIYDGDERDSIRCAKDVNGSSAD